MRLDILPQGLWEDLSVQVQQEFAVPAEIQSRCYQGLAHAVHELVTGTAQFFSHKRSIGALRGGSYIAQSALPYFYKEGYQVQFIDLKDIAAPEQWVSGLNKDTSLVLFYEDHPVTAELYPWQKLDQLLNEKKIFSVRVSHTSHWHQKPELLPYSAQICSIDSDLAVAHCGIRMRAPALLAPYMKWDQQAVLQKIKTAQKNNLQDKEAVLQFEKSLPAGFQAYFSAANPVVNAQAQRVYDRSLVYNLNLNAEALLSKLPANWQTDTTSLCKHQGVGLFDDWWQPKPSDEILRGLLLVGAQSLQDKNSSQALASAASAL